MIDNRLEAMKDHLRDEHRIKYGVDYALLVTDQIDVLCHDVWVDSLIEHAREYGIPLNTFSIVGRRWPSVSSRLDAITSFDGIYEFLSNLYPVQGIMLDGVAYPSVEHAYQAAKTVSAEERATVAGAKTGGRAKKLGRRATLRPDWDAIKVDVMQNLLQQKFANPVLRDGLLRTGERILIEGNTWHDNFWGVCWCERCQNSAPFEDGCNHLGGILMRIRNELKKA